MSITISQRTRRILALAVCNKDEAEAYCNALEVAGGAANTDSQEVEVVVPAVAAAGNDIANLPLLSLDVAVTITSITIVALGDYVGVDDSNTTVVTVKDASNNTIGSVTFSASSPPTGVDDLGTLTHNALSANTLVKISVTNGATALPPDLAVRIAFHQ